MHMAAWKFYVYEVLSESGQVVYVGKGSGRRKDVSRRERGGESCREVARFKREADAYAFEIARIAECAPSLNRRPGGNGSTAQVRVERKDAFQRTYERIGSRAMGARLLLAYRQQCGLVLSEVDSIRRVAYG